MNREVEPLDIISHAVQRLDIFNSMLWDETGLPAVNLDNKAVCSSIYWSLDSIRCDIADALELLQGGNNHDLPKQPRAGTQ